MATKIQRPIVTGAIKRGERTKKKKSNNLNQHILCSKSNYSKSFCGNSVKKKTFQLFIAPHTASTARGTVVQKWSENCGRLIEKDTATTPKQRKI